MVTGFGRMKRLTPAISAVLAALLSVSSCVSTRTKMLGAHEMAKAHVIGTVEAEFTTYQFLHIPGDVSYKAYGLLKEKAKRQYRLDAGKFDVVNISAKGKFSAINILLFCLYVIVLGNVQTIVVVGDVISLDGGGSAPAQEIPRAAPVAAAQPQAGADNAMNDAIERVTSSLIGQLRRGSAIAVFNIEVDHWKDEAWIIGEIERNFVQTRRFTMIDRSSLDAIMKEQEFQMSGAVNDRAVVKIGGMAGAKIVITGSVSKSARRLSLKALDVETGEIVAMEGASY